MTNRPARNVARYQPFGHNAACVARAQAEIAKTVEQGWVPDAPDLDVQWTIAAWCLCTCEVAA